MTTDLGRNDPCACGSGKKYKKCCLAKDEAKTHKVLEKQWTEAEKAFAKAQKDKEDTDAANPSPNQPQKHAESTKPMLQKHTRFTTPKYNMPRKAGGGA